jgi:hypothetical protein
MADLIWMSALIALAARPPVAQGGRRTIWLARAAIVVLCFNNLIRWHGVYRRHDAHWPESASRIQAVLDQRARGDLLVATEVSRIQMHPMGTGMEWLSVTIPPSAGRGR